VRFRLGLVEPCGHTATDVLHHLAVHEVAALLRVLGTRESLPAPRRTSSGR
jgi:hypothetical protein